MEFSQSFYTLSPDAFSIKDESSLRIGVCPVESNDSELPSFPTPFSGVRLDQFIAGRRASAQALSALGLAGEKVVPRAEDGCPIFPEGIVGSISHSAEIAIAVVGSAAHIQMLGIDVEPVEPMEGRVVSYIALENEIAEVGRHFSAQNAPLAIFVMKEAVYKAWWPKYRRLLWFSNITLSDEANDGSYRAVVCDPQREETSLFRVYTHVFANHVCAIALGCDEK